MLRKAFISTQVGKIIGFLPYPEGDILPTTDDGRAVQPGQIITVDFGEGTADYEIVNVLLDNTSTCLIEVRRTKSSPRCDFWIDSLKHDLRIHKAE